MHPKLVKCYLGQWVAIFQGKLVDHDTDEEALMERLQRDYADNLILVRQVEADADRELYVPSVQLVEA
jgi:hypothetical protein